MNIKEHSLRTADPDHPSPPSKSWNPLSVVAGDWPESYLDPSVAEQDPAHERFVAYIMEPGFPCVGALSAFNRKRYRYGHFSRFGTDYSAQALCSALYEFGHEFESPGNDPVTFIAMFDSIATNEEEFEANLWRQLQSLHDVDQQFFEWDKAVSEDPESNNFSFSIGGRGYFVVGLHPQSSRMARRSPAVTLVFNFHEQFASMKTSGRYGTMQSAVRNRDVALQGSINPMVANFGDASEALQYSGREAAADWCCPFSQKEAESA